MGIHRKGRLVVFLAEMGHGNPLQLRLDRFPGQLGRLVIGEMAAPARDPPLEVFRIRPGPQHVRLVIALQVCRVDFGERTADGPSGMAEIGEDAQAFVPVLDDEADRVFGVMGRPHGVYADIAECQRPAGIEVSYISHRTQLPSRYPIGRLCAIDRQAELALKDARTARVIGVLV